MKFLTDFPPLYKRGMLFGGGLSLIGLLALATMHWFQGWSLLIFFIAFFGGTGYYCGFSDGWRSGLKFEK